MSAHHWLAFLAGVGIGALSGTAALVAVVMLWGRGGRRDGR